MYCTIQQITFERREAGGAVAATPASPILRGAIELATWNWRHEQKKRQERAAALAPLASEL